MATYHKLIVEGFEIGEVEFGPDGQLTLTFPNWREVSQMDHEDTVAISVQMDTADLPVHTIPEDNTPNSLERK